ncbi:hypothetical protein EC957_003740 [Mortierella hygrophila]|uniref:Uncharacterized protein n=1 Tax=Mortierella hygrophila TaxID=979708 RepID=A0A9P6F2Z2_9FUNG|nr:hypothetical protein EC957_003740 [Mortierella hygrophila]
MLRSATSFLVLSLVAIQAAVASTIRPGTYLIQDVRSNLFLGIGPLLPVYPPMDVPLRLVPEHIASYEKWNVREGDDGGIIIFAGKGGPDDYKITSRDNNVIVSVQKNPETWDAQQVGGGPLVVAIKLPYEDKVFTANGGVYSEVTLQPSIGGVNQIFRFIPIERDLYHRNRFTFQDTC